MLINKPVAWMSKIDNHIVTFDKRLVNEAEHAGADNWMPMYLHPVKALTDEEIWEVIDNCFGVHAFNLDYQIALDEAREDAFELVKAILRKAQEK